MRRSLLLAALAAATGVGCVSVPVERDSQLVQGPTWRAELTPANGETLNGDVTVVSLRDTRDAPSRSRVVVTVYGSKNGSSHAWHIHYGVCGSDGAIVGPARSYPPIPIGAAGAAQMTLEMPFALVQGVRYFVHVHDAAAMGVSACGALLPATAPVMVATQ